MADPVEIEMLNILRSVPEERRVDIQMAYERQRKDRGTALMLQLLTVVGLPGIGQVYMGDVGIGVAQFFVTYLSCGFGWIWPLIDIFFIMGAVDNHNRTVIQRARLALL